jgi:hypothetical protein
MVVIRFSFGFETCFFFQRRQRRKYVDDVSTQKEIFPVTPFNLGFERNDM